MSLAAALGEGTTKPDNVVKVDKCGSPPKFDATREEHWGGPLNSNPEIWDASDISGRSENRMYGHICQASAHRGYSRRTSSDWVLGLMSRKEVGLQ